MTHERIVYTRRTRETFRIKTERRDLEIECHLCGGRMIGVETFALESGVSLREVFRRIEDGALHFAETDDLRIFVCTAI